MPDLLYPAQGSLYFANNIASVIEHPHGYVRLDWCPVPVTTDELLEVYEHTLQLLRESGITRILSDNQSRPPLMPHHQHWLLHVLTPRLVREAGYDRGAIIEAYGAQEKGPLNSALDHLAPLPLVVRYFSDVSAAECWLCQGISN